MRLHRISSWSRWWPRVPSQPPIMKRFVRVRRQRWEWEWDRMGCVWRAASAGEEVGLAHHELRAAGSCCWQLAKRGPYGHLCLPFGLCLFPHFSSSRVPHSPALTITAGRFRGEPQGRPRRRVVHRVSRVSVPCSARGYARAPGHTAAATHRETTPALAHSRTRAPGSGTLSAGRTGRTGRQGPGHRATGHTDRAQQSLIVLTPP